VLRGAAREPETLFIGIDADAGAMFEVSRRAARPPNRGGVPNAMFLVAAAESLPGLLRGQAHLATIALPWGSLLRGLLCADGALLAAIAGCVRPGGEVELLISTLERDASADGRALNDRSARELGGAYRARGFEIVELRPAGADDVARLSSGWGRRLGIPDRRPAWLYRLRIS
jgi:16S rRNA (adenine(1408)-N(1))-methyltransferase